MPENGTVLALLVGTGMRIGDALSLPRNRISCSKWEEDRDMYYFDYKEQKTGHIRRAWIGPKMRYELLGRPDRGSEWLFPGRDPAKHRTRQAVWKDLHRVAKLYRVNGKKLQQQISPHTGRKIYAVMLYHRISELGFEEPLRIVQADLGHSDLAVTYLYALADKITDMKMKKI